MLKIGNIQKIRLIEQAASEQYGLDPLTLMEQAGDALAEKALQILQAQNGKRVVILAGGGKNGGDGLVAARRLSRAGIQTQVLLLAEKRLAPETAANLKKLKMRKVPITQSRQFCETWPSLFKWADLVIDALLGIGLSGPPREAAALAIRAVNDSRTPVLAVDVPSGLNADTGVPFDPTLHADWTLTFGLPKTGFFQSLAIPFLGRLEVDPIGFPPELITAQEDEEAYVDAFSAAAWLPVRPRQAHKRSAGKVLLIGGSARYHGAILLAAQGAVRTGASLVTLAYPEKLDLVIRQSVAEVLCAPLPCTAEGDLCEAALDPLIRLAEDQDVVVIGPGLGTQDTAIRLAELFIQKVQGPKTLIIDADALRALAGISESTRSSQMPEWILTPHVGEATRLIENSQSVIENLRQEVAREISRRYRARVLLKGPYTTVADFQQQRLALIASGSQALAIAGTGDVLAGSIAALVAQKVEPFRAMALGAFLQGWAGSLASIDPQGLGVKASEVAEHLPYAIRALRLRQKSVEPLAAWGR